MSDRLLLNGAREAMGRRYRAAESGVLKGLLPAATLTAAERSRVNQIARERLADLRAARSAGWVSDFLQEYKLNTEEGIALLSLAEAFLRVPDSATADALIGDKLGNKSWDSHIAGSPSHLVGAASWGLHLADALLSTRNQNILRGLAARLGEPVVRTCVAAAMKLMGEVFVMGQSVHEALTRISNRRYRGFTASFDMLGESARSYADAERYWRAYSDAIATLATHGKSGHSISVKLSALHPRYETSQAAKCVGEIGELMRALARQAAHAGIGLTVDAEECDRLTMSLDVIEHVARDQAISGWDGLGMAVQAYGKRARPLVSWVEALARDAGRKIAVRLVKGAYWDAEIKRCQVEGLSDYPVFTRKAATDVSYLACARDLLDCDYLFAAFATHNALTVATIQEWAGARRDFEFQRLHGMGDGLYDRMVQEQGYSCRVYAPVGGHKELLAYLVRRLLENGANTSFVNQLGGEAVMDDALLVDPAEQVAIVGGRSHGEIPLPRDIFPGRRNSSGVDLQDAQRLRGLAEAVQMAGKVDAVPLVCGRTGHSLARSITSPADRSRVVGSVEEAAPRDVPDAVGIAAAFAQKWSETGVDQRAQNLERWADSLEREHAELMALAVLEASKTLPDAVAEVREAVDFCRYYAQRARLDFRSDKLPGPTGEYNELRLVARGVFACVSPWNFPLAIFVGQVAAALVAGNTVIAKPAPQTPLIAFRAVQLAHESGIPAEALQLMPGGAEIGRALVQDPRVAGVAFTGSTSAAKRIARDLLEDDDRPIVPLIAETGGINVMIVDSTALPEQVVADVVASAFRSAGQRCSALRLLALQEEIAAPMIGMLRGAMDTLVLGDPADPSTDIGPVIDEAARDQLEAYRKSRRDNWIHALPDRGGLFVPPTIIKLDEVEDLGAEWFGPILHVVTWKADRLDEFVERINNAGFGLTMGLHSRIAGVAGRVQRRARVGNLYVNRSMIGAVVGSQPFGGERLSGTGPKAGGPHYLARFATERTVSIDTTSAGGNATLLSLAETDA